MSESTSTAEQAAEPERAPVVARSDFETTDAEVGREFLDRAYGTSLRVHSPIGRVRLARASVGAVTVDELEFDASMTFDTDVISELVVNEPRHGTAEYTHQGVTDRVSSGDVVVSAGPGEATHGHSDHYHPRNLSLPWDAIVDAVRDVRGEDWDGDLRFDRLTPTSRAAADHWHGLVDYVQKALLGTDEVVAHPLVVAASARLLAHTVLATFPNNGTGERRTGDLPRDHRDGTSQAVQRAVAFIDSHVGDGVALAEVATAARVSPRALQYAFRRQLGTTPMGYQRRVRLDQARRDLRASGDRVTVAEVAARWGFFNQGRFAAAYRAAYGENPHRTLRRSR